MATGTINLTPDELKSLVAAHYGADAARVRFTISEHTSDPRGIDSQYVLTGCNVDVPANALGTRPLPVSQGGPEAAAQERSSIVAWLETEAKNAQMRAGYIPQIAEENKSLAHTCRSLARSIARGEHTENSPNSGDQQVTRSGDDWTFADPRYQDVEPVATAHHDEVLSIITTALGRRTLPPGSHDMHCQVSMNHKTGSLTARLWHLLEPSTEDNKSPGSEAS